MANQEDNSGSSCPNTVNESPTPSFATGEPTTIPPYEGLNPVAWTYIMSGGFTIVIGGVVLACALLRIEDKVRTNHGSTAEQRKEEPLRDVAVFFIPVALFFFTCASMEVVYQSYVYSIALCSGLSFSVSCCKLLCRRSYGILQCKNALLNNDLHEVVLTNLFTIKEFFFRADICKRAYRQIIIKVTDAATLNTLFWVGFTVGRGSGIIYANFFTPTTIIIADLIGTTTAMVRKLLVI